MKGISELQADQPMPRITKASQGWDEDFPWGEVKRVAHEGLDPQVVTALELNVAGNASANNTAERSSRGCYMGEDIWGSYMGLRKATPERKSGEMYDLEP